MGESLFILAFFLAVVTLLVVTIRVVPEYRRLIVIRLGRFLGVRGPGIVVVLPFVDHTLSLDFRTSQAEAATDLEPEGKVRLEGMEFPARADSSVTEGTKVRIVGLEGEVFRVK